MPAEEDSSHAEEKPPFYSYDEDKQNQKRSWTYFLENCEELVDLLCLGIVTFLDLNDFEVASSSIIEGRTTAKREIGEGIEVLHNSQRVEPILTSQAGLRKQEPKYPLLWLYFSSKPLRGIYYLTVSIKHLYLSYNGYRSTLSPLHEGFSNAGLWKFHLGVGALLVFGFLGNSRRFINLLRSNSRMGGRDNPNWWTSAMSGPSLMSSWFIGGGNGEWYAFLGHNGPEGKTVLPQMILEQMSLKETYRDVGRQPSYDTHNGPRFEDAED